MTGSNEYHRESSARRDPGHEPTLADDLRSVFFAFATRWMLIAAVMAVAIAGGVIYMWAAKPAYVSTVSILIDPREKRLTEREIVPSGLGSSSLGADSALVESQVEIVASRSALNRLIDEEGLLADPEFGGAPASGSPLKALIRAMLYGPNVDSYAAPSPYDSAIEKLRKAVSIVRVGNTYVLRVEVRTSNAGKSARLANRIGTIYLQQTQQMADVSTAEAATALENRLVGLLEAANAAQREAEEYRSRNGLLGAQGVLIDEQQLRNLNDQITVASIEAERAKAQLDELRRLSDQPAARLVHSNILSSMLTENLRAGLAAAISQEEVMRQTYGRRHPQFVNAVQNRQALERALTDEFSRIVGRAESDHQSAAARERSLRAMLEQLEGRQSEANSASIRLRELEQMAASNRAVYENFLQRSKEAREQIELPSVTARIISEAVPSSRPSDPQLKVVLAISAFLGLMAGAAIAWLQHLLAGTTHRLAAPSFLRLPRRPSRPIAPRHGSLLGRVST